MFRRNAGGQRGFSLGEVLAVVAIAGIVVAIGVPLVAEQVRAAKIRSAADQYAMSLKAARMIAVSKHAALPVTVQAHPANTYSYTDTDGDVRTITMPPGVRIVSSDSPITFQTNGSLAAQASTVIETTMSGSETERWTVTTSILGISSIDHERVAN